MGEPSPGPQEGALLPDFAMHFRDGRILYRRELRGRSHAAIYFVPDCPVREEGAILTGLAVRVGTWRAARAAVLIVVPHDRASPTEGLPFEPVIDRDGTLRARFGVGSGGALFVADRYGEIVLRADGIADTPGIASPLPVDEVAPTLGLLEMRCSL
jgi:hypothetical protein